MKIDRAQIVDLVKAYEESGGKGHINVAFPAHTVLGLLDHIDELTRACEDLRRARDTAELWRVRYETLLRSALDSQLGAEEVRKIRTDLGLDDETTL